MFNFNLLSSWLNYNHTSHGIQYQTVNEELSDEFNETYTDTDQYEEKNCRQSFFAGFVVFFWFSA